MKKNMKFLFALILGGLILVSCTNSNEKEEEIKNDVIQYTLDAATAKVEFTAYKFLSKKGVGGAFTQINLTGTTVSEDPLAIVRSLNFEIPINSLDTKDAGRDAKINEFFFGTINTEKISGNVVRIDEETGKAIISITMNNISKEVEGTYEFSEDGFFTFNAEINVEDWDATTGITALNNECKALHTGEGDNESKLWPDVTISFTTQLVKTEK
ncbi:MAG: YceI family protein [Brumimicrobium sp.]|nr:YceI family protein [Brumimicrobium sp.]